MNESEHLTNSPQSILVAIATYNERQNLPSLVEAIFAALPNAHILVVDDNSPDETGLWCDEYAALQTNFRVLHRRGKLGLGTATLTAMRQAVEEGYGVLITLDADWSHDPSHISALIKPTRTTDVVIGSRYCPGGEIEGWPLHRRLISRLLNGISHRVVGLPIRDSSGAFRAYRVEAIKRVNLDEVRATGYSYLEELVWHLHRSGATFSETPITFRERSEGQSKASASELFGKIATISRLLGKRWR